MYHEERALVNGVPCVRVSLKHYNMIQDNNPPCRFCPHQGNQTCDSSCGGSYVWVTVADWIALKLEVA